MEYSRSTVPQGTVFVKGLHGCSNACYGNEGLLEFLVYEIPHLVQHMTRLNLNLKLMHNMNATASND